GQSVGFLRCVAYYYSPPMVQDRAQLQALVEQTMLRDRHGLRRRLRAIRGQDDPRLERAAAEIEASARRAQERRAALPRVTYRRQLPVVGRRERSAEGIGGKQVIVLCGETGSAKTPQLPKICLELGRGVMGMIGHTQPRRIAARTVAARISHE